MQWGKVQTDERGFTLVAIDGVGGLGANAAVNFPRPLLQTENMTETATTLEGRHGWTLQLSPCATTSDQTSFQC